MDLSILDLDEWNEDFLQASSNAAIDDLRLNLSFASVSDTAATTITNESYD